MRIINNIKNHLQRSKADTSAISDRLRSEDEKRAKVREGTKWATKRYGKTFEILRDYDRS